MCCNVNPWLPMCNQLQPGSTLIQPIATIATQLHLMNSMLIIIIPKGIHEVQIVETGLQLVAMVSNGCNWLLWLAMVANG